MVIAASGAYVWSQAGGAPTDNILAPQPQFNDSKADGLAPPIGKPAAHSAGGGGPLLPFDIRRLPESTEVATATSLGPSEAPTGTVSRWIGAPELPEAAAQPTASLVPPAAVDIPVPRPRPDYRPAVVAKTARRAPQGEPPARDLVTRVAMDVAAAPARYADGRYTGPVADAYYGPIQIEAIVQGGQLVDIRVLQYPSHRRTSVAINRQALPMLRNEVVRAQTTNVDIISGATLTSEAFIRSLNGALRSARA